MQDKSLKNKVAHRGVTDCVNLQSDFQTSTWGLSIQQQKPLLFGFNWQKKRSQKQEHCNR
jgi:hypothetical protein